MKFMFFYQDWKWHGSSVYEFTIARTPNWYNLSNKDTKRIFQWLLKGALSVFKLIIAIFCKYITELFKFSYHGYSINGVDTCNKKLDINFCSNIYKLQNISLLHDCLFQVKKNPKLFRNLRCYQMLSNSHLWPAHHWI